MMIIYVELSTSMLLNYHMFVLFLLPKLVCLHDALGNKREITKETQLNAHVYIYNPGNHLTGVTLSHPVSYYCNVDDVSLKQ